MTKEIGSNFWIDQNNIGSNLSITPQIFGCHGSDYAWLSTGRSAISLVLETIEIRNPVIRKVALLPSYTCHTVIEPFIKANFSIETFPIDNYFCTSGYGLLNLINEIDASVVLIHQYFGFETLMDYQDVILKIKSLGVIIIEDKTQCLFSDFNSINADYTICSVRKWLGVPDGAFAVCTEGKFENKPTKADLNLSRIVREASRLKYSYIFMNEGVKDNFLQKYKLAEQMVDNQLEQFCIDDYSLRILSGLNIDKIKTIRKRNYSYLLENLIHIRSFELLFKILPTEVTPLYCPVRVKKRYEIQRRLSMSSIYAPIVWPKSVLLPNVSPIINTLYEELLCLPIDQRYDNEDMERLVQCIVEIMCEV